MSADRAGQVVENLFVSAVYVTLLVVDVETQERNVRIPVEQLCHLLFAKGGSPVQE